MKNRHKFLLQIVAVSIIERTCKIHQYLMNEQEFGTQFLACPV